MNLVDLMAIVFVVLGVYAEARRGLFFAVFDLLRAFFGIALALVSYSFATRLSGSLVVGVTGLVLSALVAVVLPSILLRRSGLDPKWGKRVGARIGAGFIGLLVGLSVNLVMVSAVGRNPRFEGAVIRSRLAQPFLEVTPAINHAADLFDVNVPQLSRRPARFEDEAEGGEWVFGDRINYLKLDGSTCIECRSPVEFKGYRRTCGVLVSPLFVCPKCGRTSDGCQTFEAFHRMYGHCPYEVTEGGSTIDCGVWPNDRPVVPVGPCPVCGRGRQSTP